MKTHKDKIKEVKEVKEVKTSTLEVNSTCYSGRVHNSNIVVIGKPGVGKMSRRIKPRQEQQ